MALVTLQQLIDAAADADTLEQFVNGGAVPGTLVTRLGATLKTLAKLVADAEAAIPDPVMFADLVLAAPEAGGPVIVRQSGGMTVTRLELGQYRVSHADFTVNTVAMICPRYSLVHLSYGPGAGYIDILQRYFPPSGGQPAPFDGAWAALYIAKGAL